MNDDTQMSLHASPVSHPASPMQIDSGDNLNDAPLPFEDNDEEPDPPKPDSPLHLTMQHIISDDLPRYKPFNLEPMIVKCPHCHAFHLNCEKMTELTRCHLTFGSCCMNGRVVLPCLQMPPAQLTHLFSGHHRHSHDFLDNDQSFNNAYASTSMGVKIDRSSNVG
jgi:hypothetical protein